MVSDIFNSHKNGAPYVFILHQYTTTSIGVYSNNQHCNHGLHNYDE